MAESAVIHLLANFAPFLQQEVNLLTGVRKKIQYIRDEFDRMIAFLRVADAMEENNPELKVWVKQVREASYDIGDILELYMKTPNSRYLSLRGTKVKIIPKSIGKLQNLETVDLKHTYVTELPDDILKP
ncbi:hypothetical protein ACSBR2_011267 [Camellia fascicularis]